MKCVLLSLVTLFLVAALAYSYPAESTQQQLDKAVWDQPAGVKTGQHLVRLKRFQPCEQFGIRPGNIHENCYNYCQSQGRSGGQCDGALCRCSY